MQDGSTCGLQVHLPIHLGFPDGSVAKEPTCNAETQEMWVQSLGREDPLEEEMATHSSIHLYVVYVVSKSQEVH